MHPSAPAPVRAPPSHDDRTPQGSAAQGQNAGHHPLTNRSCPTPPIVEGRGSGQRRVPSSDKLRINRCTKQRAPLRSGDVRLSVARSFAPCSIRRPPRESARTWRCGDGALSASAELCRVPIPHRYSQNLPVWEVGVRDAHSRAAGVFRGGGRHVT